MLPAKDSIESSSKGRYLTNLCMLDLPGNFPKMWYRDRQNIVCKTTVSITREIIERTSLKLSDGHRQSCDHQHHKHTHTHTFSILPETKICLPVSITPCILALRRVSTPKWVSEQGSPRLWSTDRTGFHTQNCDHFVTWKHSRDTSEDRMSLWGWHRGGPCLPLVWTMK